MERELLTAKLRRCISLSQETKHLEFEVADRERFDFIAGQFVSITAPHDSRSITRAYSIASGPRSNNTFDLCLNRVQDGFMSNMLCDLEPGDAVRFHGPHGHFVLRDPIRDSILICTGTGVAPMRGMLEWLFADESRHRGHEFWLVYGMRYATDIYYQEEFERMQAEHPNFHYLVTLSRGGDDWTGLRGYVQQHVPGIIGDRTDMDAYICGLADMVKANRAMLLDRGFDKKAVVYERFD